MHTHTSCFSECRVSDSDISMIFSTRLCSIASHRVISMSSQLKHESTVSMKNSFFQRRGLSSIIEVLISIQTQKIRTCKIQLMAATKGPDLSHYFSSCLLCIILCNSCGHASTSWRIQCCVSRVVPGALTARNSHRGDNFNISSIYEMLDQGTRLYPYVDAPP